MRTLRVRLKSDDNIRYISYKVTYLIDWWVLELTFLALLQSRG